MKRRRSKHFGVSAGERIFNFFNILFLLVFAFICIYPFYFVIIGSVSTGPNSRQAYFWPIEFSLKIYKQLLSKSSIYNAFLITTMRTVFGTILTVFCSSLLAYLVTQEKMYFRKFVYRFFILTMYIGAGLIPWYLVMRAYGFQNSFFLYIIPGIVSPYFIMLVKTYIESLPKALEESAEIDGAGFFTIFFRIIFPLCKPIVSTITVFNAVGQWNSWRDNFFLVTKPQLQTLQLMLYKYLNDAALLATAMRSGNTVGSESAALMLTSESMRMAVIVISIIPIMLIYPFLQKYFAKGIMMGAIKG